MSNTKQAVAPNPLDLVKTDDATIVALANRIKAQIVALNQESNLSLNLYEAMMTIIKLHTMLAQKSNDMQTVCNMLGISDSDMYVLIPNIENLTRRAACLSEIEEQYFTEAASTKGGELSAVCQLDWHAQPEEYAQQFGTALESRKESSPIILLN